VPWARPRGGRAALWGKSPPCFSKDSNYRTNEGRLAGQAEDF